MSSLCVTERFIDMKMMSATYICPARGLTTLEPPEPALLGRIAGIGKGLGLDRLHIPVLEESVSRTDRHKVRFLDELIRGLDHVDDAGLTVWLMAPAQRILGVDWVAPYLVKGSMDPRAAPVFVDGKMRTLRPFKWWADPGVIHKRIEFIRELVAAVSGHPALSGWIIMDRALEWPRPEYRTADLILKSYCAEIRERDEIGEICLSIGVEELKAPEMVRMLAGQVNRLYLRGIDSRLKAGGMCRDLTEEMPLTAYIYSLAHWLFEKEMSLEIGGSMGRSRELREDMLAAVSILGRQGVSEVTWLNLAEPEKRLLQEPPWCMRPGLEKAALLDPNGDPKEGIEPLIREMRSNSGKGRIVDFIDMEPKEYFADPEVHFFRLWEHFQEATR